MTEIRLPWPPTQLSPNSRLHPMQLARAKKIYRHACWAVTLEQKVTIDLDAKLRTELIFYRPTRREMDHDNLLARMKSGLDGVADALSINDRRFRPITVDVAEQIGGYVILRLFTEEK